MFSQHDSVTTCPCIQLAPVSTLLRYDNDYAIISFIVDCTCMWLHQNKLCAYYVILAVFNEDIVVPFCSSIKVSGLSWTAQFDLVFYAF